jgi:hypothetical protein
MFGIFNKKSKVQAPTETANNVFYTGAGMLSLWDYSTYQHIENYDEWEKEFVEDVDIGRNIKNADFVPINIQSDGAFCVDLKLHEAAKLSEREQKYLTVSSQPYLLKSKGKIALSGIETVGKAPTENIKLIDLDPGDYVVQIHLIAWDDEPGSKGVDGKPTDKALPDFIVCITPSEGTIQSFRTDIETFRREDIL